MTYELFLDMVKEELIKYFPKRYQDWELVIMNKAKVNGAGDAILLNGNRSFGAIPAIYVQDMYQEYLEGCPIPVIFKRYADVFTEALDAKDQGEDMVDAAYFALEYPKERIVSHLVNTDLNEELLKTVPHRKFLDLSIVYYIEMGDGWIRIDHKIADRIGYSEGELYQVSMQNNQIRRPYIVETMKNMILRLLDIPGLDELTEEEKEEAFFCLGLGPEQTPMWCLSNEGNSHGITGILYK